MLLEKSKSKSQQRLMGMVHAYQKGELNTKDMDKSLLNKIKNMAKQMKPKDTKDFAETKHKNIPQKVEILTNFYEYALLEYHQKNNNDFSITKFVNTVNNENNPHILLALLGILLNKKEHQEKIEKYYKNDINMLKFPIEVAKERDMDIIKTLNGFLNKRLSEININKTKKNKKEKETEPKIPKIGFKRSGEHNIQNVPLKKQDLKTAYRRTGLGYKHLESFNEFINTK